MPEISVFNGIRITMYYSDHQPPHFHADYNGSTALICIQTGEVIRGSLPAKKQQEVKDWWYINQAALWKDWQLCAAQMQPYKIPPLR